MGKKSREKKLRREQRQGHANMMTKIVEDHPKALEEYSKKISSLQTRLDAFDKLEVLSHFYHMSGFAPEGQPELTSNLREEAPYFPLLMGLCLNTPNVSERPPSGQDMEEIIEEVKECVQKYFFISMIGDRIKGASDAAHTAKLQSHMSQINPHSYEWQNAELIKGVLGGFDKELLEVKGYVGSDVEKIFYAVKELYQKRLNDRKHAATEIGRKIKADPELLSQATELASQHSVSVEQVILSQEVQHHFTDIKDIFGFFPNDLSPWLDGDMVERAARYLRDRSCGFGANNQVYVNLDSPNKIFTSPVLTLDDGKLFCFFLSEIFFTALPYLEEQVASIGSGRLRNRLSDGKAAYLENQTHKMFSQIFGAENCHVGLEYDFEGKRWELDLLIVYDNRLISVESKSGRLTDAAKRGAPKRLETDLEKLLQDSFEQSERCFKFIQANPDSAVFLDPKGKRALELNHNKERFHFLPISVTLEPLLMYAANPKNLQSLNMFKGESFPWAVQFSELECVVPRFKHPSIFIHYLESRHRAIRDNVFQSFDELSYLGWYLEHGTFYVAPGEDGRKPDRIMLDGYVQEFDGYYLHGKASPELAIEPEYEQMVRFLEEKRPPGYCSVVSALLSVPHNDRVNFIKHFKKMEQQTLQDGLYHDMSAVYLGEDGGWGITFITGNKRDHLQERLFKHSVLKKYQTKVRKWIGVGKDVTDTGYFASDFFYHESEWEFDQGNEDSVKLLGLKPMKKKIDWPE